MRVKGRLSRICAIATLAGLASAQEARAADPVRIPARLEWGTSVCGDAQGFASRVLQRTQRVRFVDAGEELAVFLSIEPKGTGLEARVVMKTSAGRQIVTRSIASPDCDDALDALALVVAISLDGRAQEAQRARRARPPARKRPAPAPAAPVRSEPEPSPEPAPAAPAEPQPAAQPEPSPSVEAEPTAPSPPPEPEPEPPPPAAVVVEPPPPVVVDVEREIDVAPREPSVARTGAWFAAGASAQMAIGVAPKAMFGGGLWLGATWERDSILSPSVTLGLSHVRLDFEHVDGTVDFRLSSGSLALCPVRFGNGTFELRPCASGALFELDTEGREMFFGEDALRRWGALGGSFQALARWGALELRASLAAEAPFVRDSYRSGPLCLRGNESIEEQNACSSGIFHTVGAITTRFDVGAGVSF